MHQQLDPGYIMQTATGFWASKVLLTAVELDLFTTLGDGSQTATELGEALGLHPRGTYDFFDALVALKFLGRDGDGILVAQGQGTLNPDETLAGPARPMPVDRARPIGDPRARSRARSRSLDPCPPNALTALTSGV